MTSFSFSVVTSMVDVLLLPEPAPAGKPGNEEEGTKGGWFLWLIVYLKKICIFCLILCFKNIWGWHLYCEACLRRIPACRGVYLLPLWRQSCWIFLCIKHTWAFLSAYSHHTTIQLDQRDIFKIPSSCIYHIHSRTFERFDGRGGRLLRRDDRWGVLSRVWNQTW